jgi:hypothetical protein
MEASSQTFRFPRPCLNASRLDSFLFFQLLSGQLRIREALAYDLRDGESKAVCVIQRIVLCSAIVEPEDLLSDVAVKVERLYSDIRSTQTTLQ